jgi:hypothetical protein
MTLPDDWYADMGIILPTPVEPVPLPVDLTQLATVEPPPAPMTPAEIMGLELPPDAERGQLLEESSSGMLVPPQVEVMITDGDPFYFGPSTFTMRTMPEIVMQLTRYYIDWSVLTPAQMMTPALYPSAVTPPRVFTHTVEPALVEDEEDDEGFVYWVGDSNNAYRWVVDRDPVEPEWTTV